MKYIIGFIVGVIVTLTITEISFDEFKDKIQTEIEITEDGITRTEPLD